MRDEFDNAFAAMGMLPQIVNEPMPVNATPSRPAGVPMPNVVTKPVMPVVGPVLGPKPVSVKAKGLDSQVSELLAKYRHESELGQEMDLGNPFSEYKINLADTGVGTTGKAIDSRGYGLLYRKEGSNPQGRLTIKVAGQITDLAPGMMFKGAFRDLVVLRATRSAQVGYANIIVFQTPMAFLNEPSEQVGELLQPVALLGDASAGTFVAVAENTQPSGVNPTGSFDVTGWSKIRLFIDGQAANTLTSTDLIPWLQPYPTGGIWYEQGEARFTVPDSISSAYRYRMIELGVGGRGLLYFEIRSLLPAGQTQLGFAVEGIA